MIAALLCYCGLLCKMLELDPTKSKPLNKSKWLNSRKGMYYEIEIEERSMLCLGKIEKGLQSIRKMMNAPVLCLPT